MALSSDLLEQTWGLDGEVLSVTGLFQSEFLETTSSLWTSRNLCLVLCYTGVPRVTLFFLAWKVLTNLPFERPFKHHPLFPAVRIANAVCAVQVRAFPVGTNSYSQVWGLSSFPRPLWQGPKLSLAFHSEQQIAELRRRGPSSPFVGEPDPHIFPLSKDAFIFTLLILNSRQTALWQCK